MSSHRSGFFVSILDHLSFLSDRATRTGLMVGHTHEDIDQIFSVISKALLRKSSPVQLRTPQEFDSFLQNIFNCPAEIIRLQSLYDADERIGKAANPNLRGLGHSQWALEGIKNPAHCIRMVWNGAKDKSSINLLSTSELI